MTKLTYSYSKRPGLFDAFVENTIKNQNARKHHILNIHTESNNARLNCQPNGAQILDEKHKQVYMVKNLSMYMYFCIKFLSVYLI